jgi:tetratricopeptide (TPR) repeat protein
MALVCPYRGLNYFREEDAAFFFGREAATTQLVEAVGRHSLVAVVGASGSGKSSVVRAGLVPALRRRREDAWEIVTLVPNDRPLYNLSATLLPLLEPGISEVDRLGETKKQIGDAALAKEGPVGARDAYKHALAIAERLAQADSSNTEWQRDLSIRYEKLGDVEVAAGQLDAARKAHEQALAIRERLAKADASNTQWQRDLSVSYTKLGDVNHKEGKAQDALDQFEQSRGIVDKLVKLDPTNATWKNDLDYVQAQIIKLREEVSGSR